MKKLAEYTKEDIHTELDQLHAQYCAYQSKQLKLDMSRGKPAPAQLDLSMDLLNPLPNYISENGFDVRNYGILDGLPECKQLFSDLLDIPAEQIIIGGTSSLSLMFNTVASHCLFGTDGNLSWKTGQNPVKFLCPSPGYDRHFTICQELGIEMIPVALHEHGPDMEAVTKLVAEDPSIKGIWCVPLHSNPQGVCYSDDVVEQLVSMDTAASDFRIFWDNAYGVHHIYEEVALANIFALAKKYGTENRIYYFFSTAKITFPGAGISMLASGLQNIQEVKQHMNAQTISHDKMNQLRHVRFFKNPEGIKSHMKQLGEQLKSKFDVVLEKLDSQLSDTNFATWSNPKGGYFVSLDTIPHCAKRTVALAKEAGVVLTGAGATYPYGTDPMDQNIRIAPSYPSVEELEKAMEVLIVCIKIATLERIVEQSIIR